MFIVMEHIKILFTVTLYKFLEKKLINIDIKRELPQKI